MKLFRFIIVALLLIVLFYWKLSANRVQTNTTEEVKSAQTVISPTIKVAFTEAKVLRVIDGDTIVLENGKRLRYIGMDAPETHDPKKPVQCFGKEAYKQNKKLVEGKVIRLEKDVSEADKYGRLLRYVYLGNEMINETLVKDGFAKASNYPPDDKFKTKLEAAETFAKQNNSGLWNACAR